MAARELDQANGSIGAGKIPREPTFAVAFGGGGARGIAHINVIEALDELGIRPAAISGSSIGAIMGAGMAAGMSGVEIREYAVAILSKRGEIAARLWKLRPASFGEMFGGGFRLGQFNIEKVLKHFLPGAIPETFEELAIPLSVTATDFYGQREVVMAEGDLYNAVAASAAIPALFRPVRRDDRILIDGGIYNPVPFDHLMDKARFVIAIDVVGGPEGDIGRSPSSIEAMFGASQLMMQSIIATRLRTQAPAIFLRPSVARFGVLDFLRIQQVLEESAGIKDELKRAVDAAITYADRGGDSDAE
ncbi:patatin-like phospholipase family protein [Phyllobacterium sp. SYP-B3895]|uniref:patatin-like phospholipase family protein n=1 Tax=Phyllobacterium sp. SYP-B3895 TaxID=2663240 RepID=UPI0012996536|nr:patatin-like phospholipase family protein [Phyllobacterium sp. SYP-B3895]MRG56240.1 patatin-like phospholipase family protein [Phyllobacterium sp. SYP-B3895]